ncbi:MAG: AAA family ATPase [Pirellulales bacterium]
MSRNDSGVSARLFGSFLSWLNDHESDVFVVATANDITKLPPEFSRAERFDGVFFLDLPDADQRQIKACCRLAALLDLPLVAAAQNIVPVARTSAESVEWLRTRASCRCLCADRPGFYQLADTAANSASGA